MPGSVRRSEFAPSSPSRPPTPPAAVPTADERALLEALPEPALLTRDKWQGGGTEIVVANAAFAALTGYSVDELPGSNTRLLHGPKTNLLAPRATRVAPSERLTAGACWLYRKDGVAFHATWRFAPLRPGLLVAIYRDNSESHRLQDTLLHSQKLDTVGQLTGGVAHDLNNLLSIINGYCEIMGGKLDGAPEARKDMQEIHRAGLKAASIARQILEFSRRQEPESRVVNVNVLIREIGDILRRVLGELVNVELRLASDLGNTRIDPTQFQQVLLNLCFNARDAMPQGGKFTLRTANREVPPGGNLAPGPYVVVQVSDTGIGMDEVTQQRVFESFFTTKSHGTGLGLSMALAIVRECEGTITVKSTVGEGTTFEIYLPETAEPDEVFGTPLTSLPGTRGSETVWLVEADEVLRKMVSGILAVDGYRVQEFSRAADAFAVRAKHPPQLVFLDTGTPQAVELVRKLRSDNPRLRVIGVSLESPASTLPDFPAKALAHLPKPFALSTLLRTARGLLDGLGR